MIAIVYGTRPEAIKMIPLIFVLRKNGLSVLAINTGQHRELINQVHKDFKFEPEINLDIFEVGQNPNSIISKVILGMGSIFSNNKIKLLLVQGDTTSAMAAAIAAANCKIPVGHIEAGLRSFDNNSPFPEEINRKIITQVSDYHFCPTTIAKKNLLRENVKDEKTYVVGNTGLDAARIILESIKRTNKLPISAENYIFVTLHRRESWGDGIYNVCRALVEINKLFANIRIVFATHPNELVQTVIRKELNNIANIKVIPHLPYSESLQYIKNAFFVITDSGGIQEESSYFQTPTLVARNKTERTEGIDAGCSILVGTDTQNIVNAAVKLITNANLINSMSSVKCPYGDGFASEKIFAIIEKDMQAIQDKLITE